MFFYNKKVNVSNNIYKQLLYLNTAIILPYILCKMP